MMNRSRRKFLKTSAGAAGLGLVGPSAFVKALSAEESIHPAGRLEAFPLHSVRLTPGIFKEQADINERYLDSLEVDRLLHSFRITAGIPPRPLPTKVGKIQPASCAGTFAGGHYLSAVALASATSGNSVLKARGDELVAGLLACQARAETTT